MHASEIVSDDTRKVLREGQVVEFEIGEGDRGPRARRIRITAEDARPEVLTVLYLEQSLVEPASFRVKRSIGCVARSFSTSLGDEHSPILRPSGRAAHPRRHA